MVTTKFYVGFILISLTFGMLMFNSTLVNPSSASTTSMDTTSNTSQNPSADIITYKVQQSIIFYSDKPDPVWDNVNGTAISEFGSNGFIKTVQDGTYIYTEMAYDPSYSWVAVEFNVTAGQSTLMQTGKEVWAFGTDFYGQSHWTAQGGCPVRDTINHVFYQILPTQTDGLAYVITARLLNTNDNSNFIFTDNTTFNVLFASTGHHQTLGDNNIMTWAITDIVPSGGGVIPSGKSSNTIDMNQVSEWVFVVSVVIVLVTVFMHIALRVISRPITHEKRIIYTDKVPNHPTSTTVIKNFIFRSKKKD